MEYTYTYHGNQPTPTKETIMGEYATYAGQEIKIGTCEDMFNLRLEDRAKVGTLPNSLNPALVDGL